MNKLTLILLCTVLSFYSYAQDPTTILKKSENKCKAIKNGYFEGTKHMKFMSGPDTSFYQFKGSFNNLQDDTVLSQSFNIELQTSDKIDWHHLYTGGEYIRYNINKDSSGILMSNEDWGGVTKHHIPDHLFYAPFMRLAKTVFLPDSVIREAKVELIGIEELNGYTCYHVKVVEKQEETDEKFHSYYTEHNFWINKKDKIPVQYSTLYDLDMNGDSVRQYHIYSVTKYEFNNKKWAQNASIADIPSFIKMQDYVPYKRPQVLPADTIAPEMRLITSSGDSVLLSDFKGKVVLVDFFYKNCAYCKLSMPWLQSMHENYSDSGLIVLGVNPKDLKKEQESGAITEYFKKTGNTYPFVFSNESVPKSYGVSGYPTMFVIDKEGIIRYVQVGYAEEVEAILEEEILKLL